MLGVTMVNTRLVMVSEWMVNSSIDKFVKVHADADRLELVCFLSLSALFVDDDDRVIAAAR